MTSAQVSKIITSLDMLTLILLPSRRLSHISAGLSQIIRNTGFNGRRRKMKFSKKL